jgi:hypothetical protein
MVNITHPGVFQLLSRGGLFLTAFGFALPFGFLKGQRSFPGGLIVHLARMGGDLPPESKFLSPL